MTNYQAKILETIIVDGELKAIKYWCKATDDQNSVETEGNWKMRTAHLVDNDTTEHQVLHWLDLDVTEIDTEYFINGQKRYEQYKQQPQLF